jgi:hypothetical protein
VPNHDAITAFRAHGVAITKGWERDEMNKFFAVSEELVDVTGIEPVTPCLQRLVARTFNDLAILR